ncbi:hypothetical protein [Streptomyces sp. MST-110588]|uniref:hypothetical protein n=1 Tax=Streptomyces sp. MST-110588 TaxID=2833628 RepID=UPI001F5CECFB|nr:hypothetical protein [Streptomyces sp. MST-110588]UNO43525.1 hypothetical protein KGS77_33690 [Streptomyces sp. MST-110588]
MTRSNSELMTVLVDSRRALGEQLTGLSRSVADSRREVLETVTTRVASLRAESHEIRDRADQGTAVAMETHEALAALRQEVCGIRKSVAMLQRSLDALAEHMVFSTDTDVDTDDADADDITDAPGADGECVASLMPADDDAIGMSATHTPAPENEEDTAPTVRGTRGMRGTRGTQEALETRETQEAREAREAQEMHEGIRRATREDIDHGVLLLTAAKTGTVAVVCHRDAWEFLAECASDSEHFRTTAEITDEGNGRIRAVLSGRSVIGALIALRQTRDENPMGGTWAMAGAFYSRLAEDLRTTSRAGTRPLTVVFDDGVLDNGIPKGSISGNGAPDDAPGAGPGPGSGASVRTPREVVAGAGRPAGSAVPDEAGP